jgi:hypothetical protein
MAHYAFLSDDGTNTVTEVIVGRDEGEGGVDWEAYYTAIRGQRCLRCSYNTRDGVHLRGGTPFRGTFAGIGYRYDEALDVFLPPEVTHGEEATETAGGDPQP